MSERTDPLASLRARVRALEGGGRASAEAVPLAPEIDARLPARGLARSCLHAVIGEDAAGLGFATVILARLAAHGPVLWCLPRTAPPPYAPGMAALGLPPERLIVARCGDETELLWTMEEGLRCARLGGVLGEVRGLDLTAGRRLQLAAESGGVTGLALAPPGAAMGFAASTRWRVASAPATLVPWGGLGDERWRLRLEHCRGGGQAEWLVERHGASLTTTPDSGRLSA